MAGVDVGVSDSTEEQKVLSSSLTSNAYYADRLKQLPCSIDSNTQEVKQLLLTFGFGSAVENRH